MIKNLLNTEWINYFDGFSRLIVGFSGGLDSTVLLHVLASQSSLSKKLLAVHINHGISKNASDWQAHSERFCSILGVDFLSQAIEFKKHSNIEDSARKARYAFFSSLMDDSSCLILGHHLDDQAETVLLQLFRGTGIDGLAGMPALGPLDKALIARPFLNHSRQELEKYALMHRLQWVNDESNVDSNYSRNFLRAQVIPLLKKKWPRLANTIATTASHCQQAQTNLNVLAAMDYQNLALSTHCLNLKDLKKLSFERLSNLLRVWLKNNQVQLPSTTTFQAIIYEVLFSKSDSMPLLAWKNIQIRRYQDCLYLEKKSEDGSRQEQSLENENRIFFNWTDFPSPLIIKERRLTIVAKKAKEGLDIPEGARLQVRFRQGGERMILHGQTKSLKKLMQDWQIPPWQRSSVPLLYVDNQLAAVMNYAINDLFFTKNASLAWILFPIS